MRFRSALFATFLLAATFAPAQASKPGSAQAAPATAPNRSLAYYHYSLAHTYQEMAGVYNRQDYINKAIEHFKLAMQYDPGSSFLNAELAELYASTGRIRDAVSEAEEILKRDPKSIEARRLLGRIYARSLGESPQTGALRGNQADLLKRAIEQYEKLVELDPKDVESHVVLGKLYRLSNDSAKAEAVFKKALAVEPDSEEALLTLADLYGNLGDAKSAAGLLEKLTKKNPHPRLFAMLGQFYEQAREYKKAVEALKTALEQEKNNLDLVRALGQNLLYSEQYDEALKQFQAVVDAEPQDGLAHLRLGQVYRQKHQYDKALDSLKKAQALLPDSLEVGYNIALLHEVQGSYDEAARQLKKLLDDSAKPAGAEYTARERTNRAIFLERLGFVYRAQEKFTDAASQFRQLAAMDQDNPGRGYIHLIDTLRQARDYKAAQAEAEAALQKLPTDVSLRLTYASLSADLGKVTEAVTTLKSLLTEKPKEKEPEDEEKTDNRRDIWITLAQVNERAKRFDDALAAAAEVEKLSPTKEQQEFSYFLTGSIYERAKRYQDAELWFRKALAINPDSAMTLNYLGYMWADRGTRLDEAVKMITRALEIDPQNGAYLDSLGWAYFKLNRLDLAEEYLVKASQKQARDATIRDHLADLYYKTNRLRDALREWQRALNDWAQALPADADPAEIAKVQKKVEDAKIRLAKEGGPKTQ